MNSNALHVEEEVDSKSESTENSTEERQTPKRKRYHRHTLEQIQQMEAYFKECPHPDDRQRKELGRQLGLEPIQVKFWFQNKRTQMKTQHEHQENSQLRGENDKLRAENMKYREALSNACCVSCGGPTSLGDSSISFHEHQLRVENSRLRQEIENISTFTTKYIGKPTEAPSASSSTPPMGDMWSTSMNNEGPSEGQRPVVIDLAISAMEELMRVAQMCEPLWIPSADRSSFLLNEEEYMRTYSRVFGPKMDGYRLEASRQATIVALSAANIVEILMDVEQWGNVFSAVVSRATILQVISPGFVGHSESIHLINAEFQLPSPLVPTRESYFIRYCKRHVDGTWAVMDVSIDHMHSSTPLGSCRRRPSGCLLQDMPNGRTKVVWVEHVEVDDRNTRSIYKPLISAGLAFGAKRWVAILEAYCQRLERAFVTRFPPDDINNFLGGSAEGRKSMLTLAERMVTKFYRTVNTSIVNTWTTLPGNEIDQVKMLSRKNVDDPSTPFGVQLSVATSFWLPVPPKRVFEFLCDQNRRKEWDVCLSGGNVDTITQIASGNGEGSRVTLYQVKDAPTQMVMMQESHTDPTASYVVYAPVDLACVNVVLAGGNPSYVPLLPSGFAVLPDGPPGGRGMVARLDNGGSLLTVALQILIDATPNANVSVGSVAVATQLMQTTLDRIKNALMKPQF